jgi:hypothetical protein
MEVVVGADEIVVELPLGKFVRRMVEVAEDDRWSARY